ncbi:helix-turn-helix domain-containing protein [Streptomyces sp. yr375]|uniref:helix-turn-helix domain-containing protein n=1 Tax=Streptomyces sp. yr375 TaxID=1761906 RepID=UPI0021096A60|nr:helix-turn-helix domain-containing protein [Streptomyces sp. yr375]
MVRREIEARIRTARHAADLSQLELGHLVGRDHRTVHRREYATADPSLTDLLLLADTLGLSLGGLG